MNYIIHTLYEILPQALIEYLYIIPSKLSKLTEEHMTEITLAIRMGAVVTRMPVQINRPSCTFPSLFYVGKLSNQTSICGTLLISQAGIAEFEHEYWYSSARSFSEPEGTIEIDAL